MGYCLTSKSQHYYFKYKISADSSYIHAPIEATSISDNFTAVWVSHLKERIYTNLYAEGYTSRDALFIDMDATGIDMKAPVQYGERDSACYDKRIGAFLRSSIIRMPANANWPDLFYRRDIGQAWQLFPGTDSVLGHYRIESNTFRPTGTHRTINGWLCDQWVPVADSLAGRNIAIWVCNDIPKAIDMGIFSDAVNGGIVRIDFGNGRFNELMTYRKTDTADHYPVCRPGKTTRKINLIVDGSRDKERFNTTIKF